MLNSPFFAQLKFEHPNTEASALTTNMLVTDHYLTNQQVKKLADQKITVQDVLNEK